MVIAIWIDLHPTVNIRNDVPKLLGTMITTPHPGVIHAQHRLHIRMNVDLYEGISGGMCVRMNVPQLQIGAPSVRIYTPISQDTMMDILQLDRVPIAQAILVIQDLVIDSMTP